MKNIIITTFFAFFVLSAYSQFTDFQNIIIDNTGSPEEPSIMMDPANHNRLLAGSNIKNYYYSEDGGYTWEEHSLTSNYGVWGDPCIIVDGEGYFYFLHLSNPPQGSWIDRIVSQKFDFSTHSWIEDSYMGLNGTKAQDKEWAIVDTSDNTIYVTWTQFDDYGSSNPNDSSNIMFSKSTDGGASWSAAKRINKVGGDCVDSDNTVEGAVPAVGPEGEVYVAWAGPLGIMFDKSLDGGETWLDDDIFVSDQPGGWDYNVTGISRCNGLPITVCDLSNTSTRGNIYVNWTDQRNGYANTDVWIAKSTDGGNTWSAPIKVNNDTTNRHQFFSWMDVDDATGDIYVVFYDRRNYDNKNTDVYIARSTDGGETFANIKISESPFYPSSGTFFGDYTNIVAHDGIVRPIWTRLQNGNLSVLTAIIDFTVGVEEQVRKSLPPFTMNPSYPNPFKTSTSFSFRLNRDSKVSLSVFDVMGRKVTTLINNEERPKGKYIEHFDVSNYSIAPGLYYFILQAGDYVKTQKIILSN